MLYKRFGVYDLQELMRRFDRDYFSTYGYCELIEFYEELGEDVEVDPIAISCEWSEDDPIEIYEMYSFYFKEYPSPNVEDSDAFEEWKEHFVDELNHYTWARLLDNGNVLYIQF